MVNGRIIPSDEAEVNMTKTLKKAELNEEETKAFIAMWMIRPCCDKRVTRLIEAILS